MARELNIVLSESSLTLEAKIFDGDTQIGSNISMIENSNRSGHYYGDAPISIPDGTYVIVYEANNEPVGFAEVSFVNNVEQTEGAETRIREDELAQGGTVHYIILNANTSSINNYYIQCQVIIVSGTGAGQTREIASYNGTNKRATVTAQFFIAPDSTSVYRILPK